MSNALDTSLRLVRAQASLTKRFDGRLAALHGVSLADLTVLLRLGRAEGGRMRRVDLAQAVGLTASGVTRGLIPLERIGLVVREPDPRDARVAYAVLTATGRARLGEMLRTAEEIAADVFAAPHWADGGFEVLAGLLAELDAAGHDSAGHDAAGYDAAGYDAAGYGSGAGHG
ncbi:MarR family winged helix-turn-helix transcriptional regulator [Streptacidiphilus sp. P02-A3a]|uniref:MarR family winged helix-turn-helix transcriptional regulator n=1 Tax=Streptacidiphilus sp. P02-A3a TaxID=2704468 RepID=UPI0015FCF4CB|nr:MarR family winged helix-turn-helix transcriptional regulator [Streptacidiphilus sp. P02-A3a]QMU69097.1 winged helix-turn-helix transcriptional regulator [Streptacidiphilus sp. P02-A3a]